jgi:hypothetical protein
VVNDPAPNHIDFNVSGVTTTQGNVDSRSISKNIIVNVGDIYYPLNINGSLSNRSLLSKYKINNIIILHLLIWIVNIVKINREE